MNNPLSSLFAQSPGLASAFDNIFNDTTAIPAAPPTPAALPAPNVIPAIPAGK